MISKDGEIISCPLGHGALRHVKFIDKNGMDFHSFSLTPIFRDKNNELHIDLDQGLTIEVMVCETCGYISLFDTDAFEPLNK